MANICFCFNPVFLLLLVNAIYREKTYFQGNILNNTKWTSETVYIFVIPSSLSTGFNHHHSDLQS